MVDVYLAMAVDGRDERDETRRRALVARLLSGAGARVVNDDPPSRRACPQRPSSRAISGTS